MPRHCGSGALQAADDPGVGLPFDGVYGARKVSSVARRNRSLFARCEDELAGLVCARLLLQQQPGGNMTISLSKGRSISLTKAAPGLSVVQVGLGWDPRGTSGASFDLDACVLVCDASGRCLDESWFVFYGQLTSPGNAVVHMGDNLDGRGDGDDEVITLTLGLLPPQAARIVVAVSIYDAEAKGQNFGQVANAYMRITDTVNGREVARYDLEEDFSTESAIVFGELQRANDGWTFVAVGHGFQGGLVSVTSAFGLNIA